MTTVDSSGPSAVSDEMDGRGRSQVAKESVDSLPSLDIEGAIDTLRLPAADDNDPVRDGKSTGRC